MATSIIYQDGPQAFSGLGTLTCTAASAGLYHVECKSDIPESSALLITINNNGSSQNSNGGAAGNPSPNQRSLGCSAIFRCAASDSITVVLTSSSSNDAVANAVKSTVNIFKSEA